MNWYKYSQSQTPLSKEKWGFKTGDPVQFFDEKSRKIVAGTFMKGYMSPNFPSFPTRPMGMISFGGDATKSKVSPLENIKPHRTHDIKEGSSVDLMLFPTESPAKIISVLQNNIFEVSGASGRNFKVPGYALVKV